MLQKKKTTKGDIKKRAQAAARITIANAKKEARRRILERQARLLRQSKRRSMFGYQFSAEREKALSEIAKKYIADMVLRDGTRFGDSKLADGRSVDRVIKLLRDPPLEDHPKEPFEPFGISI